MLESKPHDRYRLERLAGYWPMISEMTNSCVASSVAVHHRNRDIVQSIKVRPKQILSVEIRYLMAIWEEKRGGRS